MKGMRLAVVIAAVCAGVGCGAEAPEDDALLGTAELAIDAPNGMVLNGVNLNGKSLNGKSLNGITLDSVRFSGVSLSGKPLYSVSINGSSIVGYKSWSSSVSGSQLTGATMVGQLSNGSTLAMRIDAVKSAASPNTDVLFYSVSHQTDAAWAPLCGGANEANALEGVWDQGEGVDGGGDWLDDSAHFTFGCRQTALAKCVELGYKPWGTKSGKSLADYHQSCVRAIRADYCGNGQSFTVDGTPINIFDKLGVQADTESWKVEANWSPDGAKCVSIPRILTDLGYGAVPACVAYRATKPCVTSSWEWSVMLRTEVNK